MPRPKKKTKIVDGQPIPYRDVPPCRDMPVTQESITTPAILEEIKGYAIEGCTMEQIAHRLLINKVTLYKWTKKYPELNEVILEGKHVADDRVEQSLYEMCFGYDVREVTIKKDESGNVIEQTIKTRHIPPSATAIQYWLQNRRTDDWKSHQSLEVHGKSDVPISIVYDLNTKEKPNIKSKDE